MGANKINYIVIENLKSTSREKMEKAFNHIYQEYSYLIFYISLQIVKDNEVAKEITNDTFYKFYVNKENIDSSKNIKYYLTTTCKNLSINYINSLKKEEEYIDGTNYEFNKRDHFDEYIEKFKDFLDKDELDLIILHLLYDYSFKEIALIKGVSVNSVSSKYHRTILKVRKNYKGGRFDE